MAWRFWRWLAGQRRCVARHEAHRRRRGQRGRCGVRHQPRSLDAAPSCARCCGCLAGNATQVAGESRARSRRHGAECRSDSGDGDGEVSVALGSRVERSRRGARHSRRDSRRASHWRHPVGGRGDDEEFPGSDPNDHSVGEHALHGVLDRTSSRGVRLQLLGLLDARRHVGRRHGIHLRAGAEGGSATAVAGDHVRDETRAGARAAVRDGAGGLRLCDQRARHVRGFGRWRGCLDAAGLLRADGAVASSTGDAFALAAASCGVGSFRRGVPDEAGAARDGADAVRRVAAARQG